MNRVKIRRPKGILPLHLGHLKGIDLADAIVAIPFSTAKKKPIFWRIVVNDEDGDSEVQNTGLLYITAKLCCVHTD